MTLLSARGLSVSLGETEVLAGIDFALSGGQVVGCIGPNGAGKTTLLRALVGLVPLRAGEISVRGHPLRSIGRRELGCTLAYLPQGGEGHWAVTVETLVMLGRLPHLGPWGGPSDQDRLAVTRALETCDAAQFRDRPITHLSGGERTRVLLARALAVEPDVLLADEPVAGLDPAHRLDVMTMLRDLASSGAGVVVVTHDLTLAARFCDRLVLLHGKQVAAEGSPATVLSAVNLARCYGIRAHTGSADGAAFVVPLARTNERADYANT